jgi:hypothetical protein
LFHGETINLGFGIVPLMSYDAFFNDSPTVLILKLEELLGFLNWAIPTLTLSSNISR